jgi:hypothetical protein
MTSEVAGAPDAGQAARDVGGDLDNHRAAVVGNDAAEVAIGDGVDAVGGAALVRLSLAANKLKLRAQ